MRTIAHRWKRRAACLNAIFAWDLLFAICYSLFAWDMPERYGKWFTNFVHDVFLAFYAGNVTIVEKSKGTQAGPKCPFCSSRRT
jgi:hypothetical protein